MGCVGSCLRPSLHQASSTRRFLPPSLSVCALHPVLSHDSNGYLAHIYHTPPRPHCKHERFPASCQCVCIYTLYTLTLLPPNSDYDLITLSLTVTFWHTITTQSITKPVSPSRRPSFPNCNRHAAYWWATHTAKSVYTYHQVHCLANVFPPPSACESRLPPSLYVFKK